jgi:hydrogenase-4 component F
MITMRSSLLVGLALAIPCAAALAAALMPTPRRALGVAFAGSGLGLIVDASLVVSFSRFGPLSAMAGWFRVDALSAYHLGLLVVVHGLATAYAVVYFREELARGALTRRQAQIFGGLWCGALAAMTLLLVSDNLGMLWVGMEATTLLTAFLISVHVSRESLEAMWKYVLICSVAVAFAFMGTLLAAAAAPRLGTPQGLSWTGLLAAAPRLNPMLMRAAFVFLLVGYGTKAGLAPMHNWLPDAHSQAPAPVSALFSGFMLNAALYCVLRFLPIVNAVPGCAGWGQSLLVGFGLLSLVVGASFIVFQRDAKRLLAYCSVEHMGLIALGAGLGGLGVFAALFHSLNHSLAKCLAFFSVGRLGQAVGSHDIARQSGAFRASTIWGLGLLGSFLALLGAAPLAPFLSELQLAKATFDAGSWTVFVTLLFGLAVAFVGLLRHTVRLAWGRSDTTPRPLQRSWIEGPLVVVPLLVLLMFGLWLPPSLVDLIARAAEVVSGVAPAGVIAGVLP